MGEEGGGGREVGRPPAPTGPPPAPIQPFTARIDAALAELDAWGGAQARQFGITWQVQRVFVERGGGAAEPGPREGPPEIEPGGPGPHEFPGSGPRRP